MQFWIKEQMNRIDINNRKKIKSYIKQREKIKTTESIVISFINIFEVFVHSNSGIEENGLQKNHFINIIRLYMKRQLVLKIKKVLRKTDYW